MTNTSAYANVLLKSSVAVPAVAVPKRDYQNDSSPADFHRTLKDARENQRTGNDKTPKFIEHRKSTVEHRKEVQEAVSVRNNTEVGSATAPKKSVDQSTDPHQNCSDIDAGMGEKSVAKGSKNTDLVTEELQSESGIINGENVLNMLRQDGLTPNLNLAGPPKDAGSTLLSTSIQSFTTTAPTAISAAELLPSVTTAPVTLESAPEALDLFLAENKANALAQTAPSGTPAGVPPAATALEGEVFVNQPAAPVPELPLAAESVSEPINLFIDPAALPDAQAPAASVVAAVALAPPVQVAAPNVAEDILELLAPQANETTLSTKPASTSGAQTDGSLSAANSNLTTAQAQMQASSSAFEKTLQAIVSPSASGFDDTDAAVPSSSSTSSTSSATNPLMDTLMRGMDQQTPAARSFVVQTSVPVPVGQPQWSQAVGEKVLWLAAQNVSSAEINLHPKDLGPMQVKVSVNQEQVTVSFTSQHAVVRDVLDQNLNRLRDMFSEQGLNLANVDVSDKSFSRQQGDANDQNGRGRTHDLAQDEETPIAISVIVQQRLVDHYA